MTSNYLNIMTKAFQCRYDEKCDVWTQDQALRRGPEVALSRIPGNRKLKVLDIGAGKAVDAEAYLRKGHSYVALDLIRQENWAAETAKWGPRFQGYASAFQTFLTDQAFDLIFDSGCFHHQDPQDHEPYLQKVQKILNSCGYFAMQVYTPKDHLKKGIGQVFEDGRFAHVYNEEQISALVEPFGFELEYSERIPHENGVNFYLFVLFRKTK